MCALLEGGGWVDSKPLLKRTLVLLLVVLQRGKDDFRIVALIFFGSPPETKLNKWNNMKESKVTYLSLDRDG